MGKRRILTPASGSLASVDWQTALETFPNTFSSPRTRRAYERAVIVWTQHVAGWHSVSNRIYHKLCEQASVILLDDGGLLKVGRSLVLSYGW
jgi:hypothetical protein